MRTIKFRAWDKEGKRIRFDVVPAPYDLSEVWVGIGISHEHFDADASDFELMQFTGLHDKNGKEIYEGDIVRVYSYRDEEEPDLNEFTIHQIIWGDDYPAFELAPTIADDCNSLQSSISGDCGEEVEVIGNKFESPELLSEGRHE